MNNNFYEIFSAYNAVAEGDTKILKSKSDKRPDLTYLAWASAWQQVLKVDPNATYEVVRNKDGEILHKVGTGAMVEVKVTIQGQSKTEVYPVESMAMSSIPYDNITPTATNKAIKRAMTKCISLFGLALNLYIGEDLTEAEYDNIEDAVVKSLLNASSRDEVTKIYNSQLDVIKNTPRLMKIMKSRLEEIDNKTKKQ